ETGTVDRLARQVTNVSTIDVKVPDIGDFKDIPIIEVFVKPGDEVAVDDSLVTLESDKATMDVPSPVAGKVANVAVKVGDKVREGSLVLTLESRQPPERAATAARGSPLPRAAEGAPKARVRPLPAQRRARQRPRSHRRPNSSRRRRAARRDAPT